MNVKNLKKLFVIPAVLCLLFNTAIAENVSAQPETAVTETVEETAVTENEAGEAEVTSTPEAEAETEVVEDPDFAHTEDPLATFRLILAAVGAFAIAFMYSRMQHSKNRARNRK